MCINKTFIKSKQKSFIFSVNRRTLKNNPGVCPLLSWAKLWGLSNLRAPSMVWEGVRRSLIILHHHVHHHSFDLVGFYFHQNESRLSAILFPEPRHTFMWTSIIQKGKEGKHMAVGSMLIHLSISEDEKRPSKFSFTPLSNFRDFFSCNLKPWDKGPQSK